MGKLRHKFSILRSHSYYVVVTWGAERPLRPSRLRGQEARPEPLPGLESQEAPEGKSFIEDVSAQPGLSQLHLTGPGWSGPALILSQLPGYGMELGRVTCLMFEH